MILPPACRKIGTGSLFSDTFCKPKNRTGTFLTACWEMTKPRLSGLVLVTTFVGFVAASRGVVDAWLLIHTLIGTALVAGGAAVLNQYLERDVDALMRRTMNRPLPDGRITPEEALSCGVLLSVAGLLYLAVGVRVVAGLLAALSLGTYLFCYTPMKRKTSLCTLVGGIPGALPPMIGWAAARGTIDAGAWALGALLFLWQQPHFLAIACLHREDYARAGLPMLPVTDTDGAATGRQVLLYTTALLPVSVLPSVIGLAGSGYGAGALILGGAFCVCAARLAGRPRSLPRARQLFLASVLYLPVVLLALICCPRS